jgi:dGTP triphosphohydrolase
MYRLRFEEYLAKSFDHLSTIDSLQKEKENYTLTKELFFEFERIKDLEFEDFLNKDREFKKFLSNRILHSELAHVMDEKADYVIQQLFQSYLKNPMLLPDNTIRLIVNDYYVNKSNIKDFRFEFNRIWTSNQKRANKKLIRTVRRKICDYIGGMTDQYAMDQYHKMFGTNSFRRGV